MAEPVFHPEARNEYEAAYAWYRERSPETAERFEAEMERTLGLIAVRPNLFPQYDEIHRFPGIDHFPYKIVYRIDPHGMTVVALAHVRRRPAYWASRR